MGQCWVGGDLGTEPLYQCILLQHLDNESWSRTSDGLTWDENAWEEKGAVAFLYFIIVGNREWARSSDSGN